MGEPDSLSPSPALPLLHCPATIMRSKERNKIMPSPHLVIDALPTLSWVPVEGQATVERSTQTLTMRSAGGADWSNDATGGDQQHKAASLAFLAPPTPFMLSAKVSVQGDRTTFDAGALSIWSDEDHWAKLCFENSPAGETMVVSVVTNTYSDDVNSHLVADAGIYLRLAFLGNNAWAFHSSPDGEHWNFVRLFNLPVPAETPTYVGFLSQAPFGERCDAVFRDIEISHALLSDTRNGS
ncbi:DUF1349 domain-containing protein [Streptomyces sp. CA-278952]|uniref:DUF1349 domain-containing protein n=1 Tax=unclassified Streptomyces TaxID=2593676 RepID=UPI002368C4F2|nr:DUF1349 domain-containing protein [Streptomyces sp. CA-278952]WDG27730.1 DUF1349 domain-containing protein [Streptomyces sp. CA-278952]